MIRALVTALLAAAIGLAAGPAAAKKVLFLTAPPLQAGKFERIIPLAKARGIEMTYRFVDSIGPETTPAELSAHDLLVIYAPYGAALAEARSRLGPLLPGIGVPWLWVQSGGVEAKGVDRDTANLLHTYYLNGGERNHAAFMCQVDRRILKAAGPDCAPPQIFPESALYHPDADEVFEKLEDYLAWRGVDRANPPPAIAFIFHKSYLGAGLTGFIHDMIRRIEAAGAVALPIYVPAVANGEITRLVTLDGKPFAGVLVNAQIMLNAEGRKAEFEALGVPVMQAVPYRDGERADWEADTAGISPQGIPFYLAQPEYAGVSDPLMSAYTRKSDGDVIALEEQAQSVVNKAMNLIRLQRLPNAEKKTAILFYNYPSGEKNLGASFLNVPRSLEAVLAGMKAHGHTTEARDSESLIRDLTALLTAFHRDGELRRMAEQGLVEKLPFSRYLAWFDALPEHVRQPVLDRWGPPERSAMAMRESGERFLAVPRLKLGNVVLMPQPPRGDEAGGREKALYHDTKAPPSHAYLAAYLWLREEFGAHALVHFGTHGTAEWQRGKERGRSILEYPYLVSGDVRVLYPYIVDNIGEALQTKRRGRAVTISHSTPAFAPAGLHGEINRLHGLLHTWKNMEEGEVRVKTAEEIRALATAANVEKDMGWDATRIGADFAGFVDALHVHLHDLALAQQPLGLATFGVPAESDLRLSTVMQMLGRPLLEALMPDDPEEMLAGDHTKLKTTPVWEFLDRHVRRAEPFTGDAKLAELIEKGRGFWNALTESRELASFLAGLDGRFIPTSYGGDPIKNPDSLPTGRNLYSFDPSRVPTAQAWEAGREAAEKLIAQHREQHGAYPEKLAFSLWSVETMRHFGVLEAQALAVMGFRPKWNDGGQVVGVEPIPAGELGRPRVDAVISATGLYRDHFPAVVKWLAEAARQASELDEPGNAVAANARAIETSLRGQGVAAEDAARLAKTRVFSSESGAYGTGLNDATGASDTWGMGADGKEDRAAGDAKLAQLYLGRMQFAYGPDEERWGEKPPVNAYAEHLKGVDGAVLSRSSNLYGMLTTDDPFQYLGGIGLAVRHLTGKSPELYISNLRQTGATRVETAAGFLSRDLVTRYFHPNWIAEMQKEGYSGTLEILDTVNNLWGWQAVAPETVRDDQWNELKAVYIDDKHKLGVNEWFEQNNPHAQAQIIERMLEAARKEYWKADPADVAQLARRWQELAERHDIVTENRLFQFYVAEAVGGYGLEGQAAPDAATPTPPEAQPAAPQPVQVQGQILEKQEAPEEISPAPTMIFAVFICLAAFLHGVLRQARRRQAGAPLIALHQGA